MANLATNTGLAIRVPSHSAKLPDNNLWTNRFEIHSQTSNRVYIVAQNKQSGGFACSCPGWRTNRKCKHLVAMGIPDKQMHGRTAFLLKKQDLI